MERCDVHCHTTFSDGTETPRELVHHARLSGLATIAITDHDTCGGVDQAVHAGQIEGVRVIPGIEVASRSAIGELHILGLWVPAHDPDLVQTLNQLRAWRNARNCAMLRRLCDLGLSLSQEEVQAWAGSGAIGRPHIARALVHKGYVSTIQAAFARYLGEGCPAYVPKETLSPEETIAVLVRARATVALAHPCLLRCSEETLFAYLRHLAACGLDAIEAWHSEHSAHDTRLCCEWARTLGLGLTGGSDYHGSNKPGVHLGRGRHNLCLDEAVVTALLARRKAQGYSID